MYSVTWPDQPGLSGEFRSLFLLVIAVLGALPPWLFHVTFHRLQVETRIQVVPDVYRNDVKNSWANRTQGIP